MVQDPGAALVLPVLAWPVPPVPPVPVWPADAPAMPAPPPPIASSESQATSESQAIASATSYFQSLAEVWTMGHDRELEIAQCAHLEDGEQ